MATDRSKRSIEGPDGGFTLTELLIVVVMMGVLMTTLTVAVSVVLRTSPSTEARADDARSIQGLVTWLPQDVDAAAPDGFHTLDSTNPLSWPCAAPGPDPATSKNVLTIEWDEPGGTTTNYAATYRYEAKGSAWTMVRYVCEVGEQARRFNLTSDLAPWNDSDPPAWVVMCQVSIEGATATCPTGELVTGDPEPTTVRSLKLIVRLKNGLESTIDAAPKNPDKELGEDPDAAGNVSPHVPNPIITVNVVAGAAPTQIDLYEPLGGAGINDPDDVAAQLHLAEDNTPPPLPADKLTVEVVSPWLVEFWVDESVAAPFVYQPLYLLVVDEYSGWTPVTVLINVTPPPANVQPTVLLSAWTLQIPKGETRTLPNVLGFFGADDDDGDPLTVTVESEPVGVDASVADLGGGFWSVEIDLDSSLLPTEPDLYPEVVVLTVSDGNIWPVPTQITISVMILPAAVTNDPPIAAQANIPVTIQAGSAVTIDLAAPAPGGHGIYDPDADPLAIVSASGPPADQIEIELNPGTLTATLTADPTLAAEVLATPVTFVVQDTDEGAVTVTVTITITEPPPPPPSCVLGALTASPNPVARQGSGSGPRRLSQDVLVTLNYTGVCDGLRLTYNSGDPSGLGTGIGRLFPPGSPTQITIFGHGAGGTEKFAAGNIVLTAWTSTVLAPPHPTSTTTTLVVL